MRVLLAIGCNTYDHVPSLGGAEADASRIFEILLRPEAGDYDLGGSRLLLSPTLEMVRRAVAEALFEHGPIDTFTFYFAGHGRVAGGSFYMAVRDSKPNALSVSSFSLSDLFRGLGEAAPKQSNVIIDACESAGLISDLNAIVKPNLMGNQNTPEIALLATSAMNQGAGEDELGGCGTVALLKCIDGQRFIQDDEPTLGLIEIGHDVVKQLSNSEQSPAVWGLNLSGAPRFCKNPKFNSDPATSLREVVRTWPTNVESSIRAHYDDLWRQCEAAEKSWSAPELLDLTRAVYPTFDSQPELLASFTYRLADALGERAHRSKDAFRPVLVCSALCVSLLPHLNLGPAVLQCADRLAARSGEYLLGVGAALVEHLKRDRFALLASEGGGLFDLYQLPIRVSQVLGWMAMAPDLLAEAQLQTRANEQFVWLLKFILKEYPRAITSMTDAQAPYWATTLSRAMAVGLVDEAEELLGLVFHALVACTGALARWDLPGDRAYDYVRARAVGDFSGAAAGTVERPIETLTVLLRIAGTLGMQDVFDESMWKLDGVSFAAHLNSDFRQFGSNLMSGGSNLVWTVGDEVCRVDDFLGSWPEVTPTPDGPTARVVSTMASLLLPDRVAWYLL